MSAIPSASQGGSEVRIKTPLGADVLLLQNMTMTEEIGRLFTIDLELLSTQEDIKFEDILGKRIIIEMDLVPDGVRFFNGHITKFSQTGNSGKYAVYQATVRPWLWFLTRTADCRIFNEGQTVPEIVKQICKEQGFTDIDDRLTATYRPWEYCVQYRETDFNFISRLLEQEGIHYYFTHEKDGVHKLVLSDPNSNHDVLPDAANIPYYPPDESVVREEEHISSWYISKQVQPGKYELNEFDFEKPTASLISKSEISREHSVSDYEIYDYPGEYVKTDNGDEYVQARIEELHSQYEQAQGQSDVRVLKTGCLFSLTDYSREDQNREYLIVSATHHVNGDVFDSSGSSGAVYSNSFSVVESSTPYRAERKTPKPIIQGAQTAIVVGNEGEEIDTDEYGRVWLKFHWDRRKDELGRKFSCPIRVSQIWAGKKWGGIHIPRIGQEVIVEFLEGDPDRPIITGRVYNKDQMPPYDLPKNKTQSGIKSRSSKKGTGSNFNEIRMEDKKGKEQLYIHAEKNQDNIVENDETTSVGHDRTETVGNDETITIKNDRTEDVGNDEDITIGHDRTEKVGRDEDISIGHDRTENVGNDEKITIANDREEKVGKDETISIGNTKCVTIGTNKIETVGKVISVTAGNEISFSVGNSLLVMKKDGTIKLSGKDISITATKKTEMGVGSQNTTHDTKQIESTGAQITSAAIGTHNITGALIKIN